MSVANIRRWLAVSEVIKISPRDKANPALADWQRRPSRECYMGSDAVCKTPPRDSAGYFLGMVTIASDVRIADKRQIYPPRATVISWIFFDWAAQPYFTLITTFAFAPYFRPLQAAKLNA
jgi:hypothetical protein